MLFSPETELSIPFLLENRPFLSNPDHGINSLSALRGGLSVYIPGLLEPHSGQFSVKVYGLPLLLGARCGRAAVSEAGNSR
jgi:hypothetical protein